jgi:predicted heme/steroid binding protein/uncharacterized membrane protein
VSDGPCVTAGASRLRWPAKRQGLVGCGAVVLFVLLVTTPALATQQYAAQTQKPCSYCHVSGGGSPLTPAGEAFRAAGYQLPAATTQTSTQTTASGAATTPSPGATTTSTGAGGTGETTAGGAGSSGTGGTVSTGPSPLVRLPWLVRDLLLWLHLVGIVAWLGAIIFVHVIQTPRVAGRGIPRHYLQLAWPSIVAVAVSGTLLTLDDITAFSQLTDSRWGVLLLVKIFIFVVLVAVAALATFVLSPRLRRQSESGDDGFATVHERARAAGSVTVSFEGTVYDLSTSRIWRNGRHARRHDAWADLSGQIAEAPHGREVLGRFPVLEGKAPPVFPVQRVFVVFAYGNLALVLLVLLVVAFWR